MMKPWKLVLGAGAACVACCAAPVAGAAVTLWLGVSGLAAAAAGLLAAFTGFRLALALGALALVAAAGAVAWRGRERKRRATTCAARGSSVGTACAWPRIGP